MTTEQKAKAYDEALKRAREIIQDYKKRNLVDILFYAKEDLECIFPELKESEDERILEIIKHCIESRYLHTSTIKGISQKQCFAWLEKQGDKDRFIKEEIECIKGYREKAIKMLEEIEKQGGQKPAKNIVETWKDMRLEVYQQASGNRHEPNYSDDSTKMFSLNDIDEIFEKIAEKQGEQKFEMKSAEESLGISSEEYNDIVNECLYGESNSSDKVEPKFKVGDWVVTSYGKVNQVVSVDKDGDGYTLDDGMYFSGSWYDVYHLWTIQDAKDGDVLVNGSNIFIFHFINDTRLMGYCHVNTDDGRFYDDIGKNECFCLIDAVVNPATKEQRDTLFLKMKEAGYEWSEETHELKKLSQRMISAEVKEALYDKPTDEEMKELLRTEYEKGRADTIAEMKSSWSEEDINKPNGGIVMEDFNDGNGFYKVNLAYLNEEQVKEIEELVKRWGCQPKENEDESIISDLLDYFDEDK